MLTIEEVQDTLASFGNQENMDPTEKKVLQFYFNLIRKISWQWGILIKILSYGSKIQWQMRMIKITHASHFIQ